MILFLGSLMPIFVLWMMCGLGFVIPMSESKETALFDYLRGVRTEAKPGQPSTDLGTWDVVCLYFVISFPLSVACCLVCLVCSWVTQSETERVQVIRHVTSVVLFWCFMVQIFPVAVCITYLVKTLILITMTVIAPYFFVFIGCAYNTSSIAAHTRWFWVPFVWLCIPGSFYLGSASDLLVCSLLFGRSHQNNLLRWFRRPSGCRGNSLSCFAGNLSASRPRNLSNSSCVGLGVGWRWGGGVRISPPRPTQENKSNLHVCFCRILQAQYLFFKFCVGHQFALLPKFVVPETERRT